MRPAFIVAAVAFAFLPLKAQMLPEGEGRGTVQGVCNGCHGLDVISGQRATRQGWAAIIDNMVARGATLTDDQKKTALDYLTATFGKVNVNTATAQEISAGIDVSPALADMIVQYRKEHGPWTNFEGFAHTPGLDPMKMEKKKDRIAFR